MGGKASHVHFINYGTLEGPVQDAVAFPIVSARIDDHALDGMGNIISGTAGCLPVIIVTICYRTGIGIDEQLLAVKAQTSRRLVRAANPVAIQLAMANVWDKHMPVI